MDVAPHGTLEPTPEPVPVPSAEAPGPSARTGRAAWATRARRAPRSLVHDLPVLVLVAVVITLLVRLLLLPAPLAPEAHGTRAGRDAAHGELAVGAGGGEGPALHHHHVEGTRLPVVGPTVLPTGSRGGVVVLAPHEGGAVIRRAPACGGNR